MNARWIFKFSTATAALLWLASAVLWAKGASIVTVGTGHDSFIFEQGGMTTPSNIGAVTITGFDTGKDVITFSTQLTTSVSYHDNAQGNAVVTVDNSGDTITLVGVHASELHPSNFHFVDPAAVPCHRDDRADGGGLARPQYPVMRRIMRRR